MVEIVGRFGDASWGGEDFGVVKSFRKSESAHCDGCMFNYQPRRDCYGHLCFDVVEWHVQVF